MGFCYCWLPSVWHRASRVENCLESCMKYNRAQAICCSTFQRDVYFELKKKGGKKLLSLAIQKIPLVWLLEHMLLVAVMLSKRAARTGALHTEVIYLILLVTIYRACRSGLQAWAVTLWQENKDESCLKEVPYWSIKCASSCSAAWFYHGEMGSSTHLYYLKKLGEHLSGTVVLGHGVMSSS